MTAPRAAPDAHRRTSVRRASRVRPRAGRWALGLSGAFVVAALVLVPSCTPVPIVSYDAAVLEAGLDGGDSAAPLTDASDAEAGPKPRREWDAGVEDDAFPAASDELELRMRHLLEAIAAGDPALAPDLLYPRDAWVRAHDAHDPGKLWDTKVKPYFLKDIARLHKSQKSMERARFVSFELGHALTHVQPRAHDLKRPVWRVRGSKLTFTIDDKPKRFVIAEMTAFRGAWYVTKLR